MLVLKEIYSLHGLNPTIPGTEGQQKRMTPPPPRAAIPPQPMYGSPPLSSPHSQPGFMGSPGQIPDVNMRVSPSGPEQGQSHMYSPNVPFSTRPPTHVGINTNVKAPSGPPPFSVGQPAVSAAVGPPPISGFVKKS